MFIEPLILIVIWLVGVVGFILFIPHDNRREGILALMIFQAVVWLCDMPAFKYHLLSAPVREFPKATDLTFTINYFLYPVLFAIYYVHKRQNSKPLSGFAYFFVWTSFITLFDNIIEIYTDLLEYEHLSRYGMWFYIGFLFYVSQICCNWFFKDKSLFDADQLGTH
jgi:TRAP-type uncharacterized transport system fused permease subunit